MRRGLCLATALYLLAVFSVRPATAQVSTGEIFGRVADTTGAVMPGVNVTISSPALLQPQTVVTASSGGYRFPLVPIGTYTVRYELSGGGGRSRRPRGRVGRDGDGGQHSACRDRDRPGVPAGDRLAGGGAGPVGTAGGPGDDAGRQRGNQ